MRRALRAATWAGVGWIGAAAPALASEEGGEGLLWPSLNLLLLVVVLVYFARKPVQQFFLDRRQAVQGALEAAAAERAEAEARYGEWQRKLIDLDAELERIRATSRERTRAEGDRILADAHAAAERIRSEARAAIELELRDAREQLREEAADLAVQLAAERLESQVTDADRDRLLDEFIARVEQEGRS